MPTRTVINSRYELDELPLARGGMGEVRVGYDIKLERDVAVKFIRFPDDQRVGDPVQREQVGFTICPQACTGPGELPSPGPHTNAPDVADHDHDRSGGAIPQ